MTVLSESRPDHTHSETTCMIPGFGLNGLRRMLSVVDIHCFGRKYLQEDIDSVHFFLTLMGNMTHFGKQIMSIFCWQSNKNKMEKGLPDGAVIPHML